MRENDPKRFHVLSEIKDPTYRGKGIESNVLSEASKIDFKTPSHTQEYNIPSKQEKGQNEHNFITLSNLSEDQKIRR